MKIPGLRSPNEKVGGLVYFGRMLDKIRLHDKGLLPKGFNLGTKDWYFFDARCCRFLGVKYSALKAKALKTKSDLQVLKWCYAEGKRPNKEQIEIWNAFISKRGWRDAASGGVEHEKKAAGLGKRKDILTWFDLYDAEEK